MFSRDFQKTLVTVNNQERESYLMPLNHNNDSWETFEDYLNFKKVFIQYNQLDLYNKIFNSIFPKFYYPSMLQFGTESEDSFLTIYYRFKKNI